MAGFAERLSTAWYRKNPGLLYLLLPLEGLYRAISALRRRWQVRRAMPLPIPVVVVGNITVGGTGKTPAVIGLTGWLQQIGFRPGIVSRGYGGGFAGEPTLVGAGSDAALVGDEAVLLARRTGVPVVVARQRRRAVEMLAKFNCDIAVSDDGLQHYAMPRALEIAVVDGQRGFGNGHCLPVGPLREPPGRLRAVDAVLVNGGVHSLAVKAWPMTLVPEWLEEVGGARSLAPDPKALGANVHAVAGIGRPERFFETLAALGFTPIRHPFPDHYRFVAEDFRFGDALPIIMTGKDAVKCAGFGLQNCWSLSVRAQFGDDFLAALKPRLPLSNR